MTGQDTHTTYWPNIPAFGSVTGSSKNCPSATIERTPFTGNMTPDMKLNGQTPPVAVMRARERSATISDPSANTQEQHTAAADRSEGQEGHRKGRPAQMTARAKGKRPLRDAPETPGRKKTRGVPDGVAGSDESPGRHNHRRYDKCKPETQRRRDGLVDSITVHWNAPFPTWLPKGLAPMTLKLDGVGLRSQLKSSPLEPRDWSTPFLAAVERLSLVTRNDVDTARRTLAKTYANRSKLRKTGLLAICDVEAAVEHFRAQSITSGGRGTPVTVPQAGIAGPSPRGEANAFRADPIAPSQGIQSPELERPIKVESEGVTTTENSDPAAGFASATQALRNAIRQSKAWTKALEDEEFATTERIRLEKKVKQNMKLRDQGGRPEDAILV